MGEPGKRTHSASVASLSSLSSFRSYGAASLASASSGGSSGGGGFSAQRPAVVRRPGHDRAWVREGELSVYGDIAQGKKLPKPYWVQLTQGKLLMVKTKHMHMEDAVELEFLLTGECEITVDSVATDKPQTSALNMRQRTMTAVGFDMVGGGGGGGGGGSVAEIFPFTFTLIVGGVRKLYLGAKTQRDMLSWMRDIEGAYQVETYKMLCQDYLVTPLRKVMQAFRTSTSKLVLDGMQLRLNEFRALCERLEHNRHIRVLSLAKTGIADAYMHSLQLLLQANNTIQVLNLSNNHIGTEGVRTLVDGLLVNATVADVTLAHNVFGDRGCEHLAVMLRANAAVAKLDLAGNRLTAKGVRLIARTLYSPDARVRGLNLSSNAIGDKGAAEVADVLAQCHSLFKLGLAHCDVGNEGFRVLARGLRTNQALDLCNVSHNTISDAEVAREWCAALQASALTTVEMSSTPRGAAVGVFAELLSGDEGGFAAEMLCVTNGALPPHSPELHSRRPPAAAEGKARPRMLTVGEV